MHSWLLYILFGLVVVGNVLWYRTKFLLRSHGFPTSFIWHGSDLPNLYRLYQRESDPRQRRGYLRLMIALYTSVALFVAVAAVFFVIGG